jgi:hypothetical protein
MLPLGPVTYIGALLATGFVGLIVYQAVRQGSSFQVPTRDFLAFFIIVGFMAVVAYMFVGKPNEGADILIGALIAAFSAIVAMYFRGGKNE